MSQNGVSKCPCLVGFSIINSPLREILLYALRGGELPLIFVMPICKKGGDLRRHYKDITEHVEKFLKEGGIIPLKLFSSCSDYCLP